MRPQEGAAFQPVEAAFIIVLELLVIIQLPRKNILLEFYWKIVDLIYRKLRPSLGLLSEVLCNCPPLLVLLGDNCELEPLVILEEGQH